MKNYTLLLRSQFLSFSGQLLSAKLILMEWSTKIQNMPCVAQECIKLYAIWVFLSNMHYLTSLYTKFHLPFFAHLLFILCNSLLLAPIFTTETIRKFLQILWQAVMTVKVLFQNLRQPVSRQRRTFHKGWQKQQKVPCTPLWLHLFSCRAPNQRRVSQILYIPLRQALWHTKTFE